MDGSKGLATTEQDTGLSTANAAKVIDSLVTRGDWSGLGPEARARAYTTICERLGLDPYTQPFEFLRLNGKEVMYARRGATDQLAAMHRVTREIIDGPKVIDLGGTKLVYCVAKASLPSGRYETATATVPLIDPVNVLMKCETKAKRRATLSLLSLGCLDESETDTIPGALRIDAPQVERRQLDGAPAENAPVNALASFASVVAECNDLATIGEAYRNAGLGGTLAADIAKVVQPRTKALGYHLNAAEIHTLCGDTFDPELATAYESLREVARREDDADGDGVIAAIVRVLRHHGGMPKAHKARLSTVAIATAEALRVADAKARITAAVSPKPTPPDGGPGGGQRTLATQDSATATPLPTGAANDAAQASAGPRLVADGDAIDAAAREREAALVTDAAAWRAHLATHPLDMWAIGPGFAKRAETFRAASTYDERRRATLDALEHCPYFADRGHADLWLKGREDLAAKVRPQVGGEVIPLRNRHARARLAAERTGTTG